MTGNRPRERNRDKLRKKIELGCCSCCDDDVVVVCDSFVTVVVEILSDELEQEELADDEVENELEECIDKSLFKI